MNPKIGFWVLHQNVAKTLDVSSLIKMSVTCSVVGTLRTQKSSVATRSRMECRSISTCFVR
jgi:hypothetical protein